MNLTDKNERSQIQEKTEEGVSLGEYRLERGKGALEMYLVCGHMDIYARVSLKNKYTCNS